LGIQVVKAAIALVLVGVGLGGCAGLHPPQNLQSELYSPEKSAENSSVEARPHDRPVMGAHASTKDNLSFSSEKCAEAGDPAFLLTSTYTPGHSRRTRLPPMRYSPGDRFNLLVYQGPEYNGDYAVNVDGMVILPFAGQIEAVGLTNNELMARIREALIRNGIFTREALKLSTRPVQYAPINITVAGAVFQTGRHTINAIKDSDKFERALMKFGDSPEGRFVPSALRAAGGVRPDADLTHIKVIRDGRVFRLNWSGAITGGPVDDMPLIEGDHIEVGEAGCFQSALVRPSQITPPSVRVFFSNLSAPSYSNSQVNSDTATIPYGTRLLQGLVNANCVGGSVAINARRYAVLISRNPKTRKTEVLQRSIEELVRSADRDTINPYLMPDDAIACYDSAVTELVGIVGVVNAIMAPAQALQSMILAPKMVPKGP